MTDCILTSQIECQKVPNVDALVSISVMQHREVGPELNGCFGETERKIQALLEGRQWAGFSNLQSLFEPNGSIVLSSLPEENRDAQTSQSAVRCGT